MKGEKVIKAFEFCLMPPSREELENDICSHEDCPYYREYNGGKCVSALAADALALLPKRRSRMKHGLCGVIQGRMCMLIYGCIAKNAAVGSMIGTNRNSVQSAEGR